MSKFLELACYLKCFIAIALLQPWQQSLLALINAWRLWQPQIASSRGAKQEQASIEQQLEVLRAGKVRTGEDIGAGWIGTTEDAIKKT
jgi:hypothetical protein